VSDELRYVHVCAGCGGSYEHCRSIWPQQRVCCPDCDHHRAHPPPGSWRDFFPKGPDERDWYEFDLAREADPLMEAGHA
jgi:hypothetical protein